MADRSAKQGPGILGIGAAACAACCALPLIGFLAAASIGTLIGVAAFGVIGLAVLVPMVVAYLRRAAQANQRDEAPVPVAFGRKPDA